MTVSQLRKALHAIPFQPFVLHTADGKSFRVKHPEFVALSPRGLSVAVYGDDDAADILDMRLIASLEIGKSRQKAEKSAKTSNGD